jgi:hypothetical protein
MFMHTGERVRKKPRARSTYLSARVDLFVYNCHMESQEGIAMIMGLKPTLLTPTPTTSQRMIRRRK